ncbi:MAG: signal transduction histidine kinase [Myxococcota bacterium]|jgi:signal transduction histidine kinase
MLGFALLALTVFAFLSIQSQRARLETRVQEDISRDVAARVDGWESRLRESLDGWLSTAANGDARTAPLLQGQLQGRHRWFDSLYIWSPPVQNQDPATRRPGRMLFPSPAQREDPLTRQHQCVAATQAYAQRSSTRPSLVAVAEQYVLRCSAAPLNVRMHAYGEAAQLYDRAQRPQDALAVLEMVGVTRDLPAREGIKLGLTPFLLTIHKLRTARVLDGLGRVGEAAEVWVSVARDIASLDAPSAGSILAYEWDVMHELRLHGSPEVQRRVASLLSRANRRAGAWDEVRQRTVRESAQFDPFQPGSFAYDQYQDTGFLLYYRGIPTDTVDIRAGAVVLDQTTLLQDFMATMGPLAKHARVTDAAGNFVTGAEVGTVALWQTFPATLTHLRIEIDDAAVTAQIGRFGGQYYSFLAALGVFVTIGFLGLFAQHRASLHLENLLMRQREFTTRITHELKTPLAGIRVTAENIDIGAFKTQDDLSLMAGRIVTEADALTERVDEILAVSRERIVPRAELFDVEDIVLQTLSTWSPRYDQVGVILHADLHVTDEVKGDPVAVRDAVSCLLDNALKYRDDSRDDRAVWLTLKQDGRFASINVSDNGLGVPPKLRKSIFKQFVRVEGPNRGKAGGHGLGLAQVTRVARAHGGSCVCSVSEQGGARFVLRLRGQG